MLNTPQVNISTVEDPVEYRIPGVNQTQVNPAAGMTFAGGLRALLRQDPNIIMVGEIRDGETADLAIQAALTGHLVLSTLHTNNAATTLPRLLDMGAEPFLIASTVRAVVGQRLVRKLCPNCRTGYEPGEDELSQLKEQFGLRQSFSQLLETAQKTPTSENPSTQTTATAVKTASKKLTLWKAGKGCEVCNLAGYVGRIGIYEVLEVTEAIRKAIVGNAISDEIQHIAVEDGMITMQNDGLMKSFQGLTTVEEVLRVTRE